MFTEAARFSHPFVSRLALMALSRGLSARNWAMEVLGIGVPTGSAPSSATEGFGGRPITCRNRAQQASPVAGCKGKNMYYRKKARVAPTGLPVTRQIASPYSRSFLRYGRGRGGCKGLCRGDGDEAQVQQTRTRVKNYSRLFNYSK